MRKIIFVFLIQQKQKGDKSQAADVIRNWLRNRSTLDFLIAWEELYNPNFKVFESEHFRKQVGLLTFTEENKMNINCDKLIYRNTHSNS